MWHPRYGAADSWEPVANLRTQDSDQELLTNYLAMLQRARAATALLEEQCPVCFATDTYRGAPDHTIVTRFNCQHGGFLWVDSSAARSRKGARAGRRVDRRGLICPRVT